MTVVVPGPMAEPTAAIRAVEPTWRRLRFGLLVALAALAACALTFSTRPATMAELKSAIAAGRASEVSIHGALPAGATGTALVHISWRDGQFARLTEVLQGSAAGELPQPQPSDTEQVVGDLVQQLRNLNGAVSVQVAPDVGGQYFGPTVAGWRLPIWLGLAGLGVVLAALFLLVNGPEPWWATRWAWFWVFFSPLAAVGVPLFLIMSGPPPGVPQPTERGRRLTGGWAFLLVTMIVSAVGLTR